MRNYEPSTPRVALGLAAAAMTAITMSAFVLVPAKTESYGGSLAMHAPAALTVSCTTDKGERASTKS